MWLLIVRLRREQNHRYISQELVNRFFEHIEQNLYSLNIPANILTREVKDRIGVFHGGVLAYDEGLCATDAVLAGALWRNLNVKDPIEAAWMTRWVRRECQRLEKVTSEEIQRGLVEFEEPLAAL